MENHPWKIYGWWLGHHISHISHIYPHSTLLFLADMPHRTSWQGHAPAASLSPWSSGCERCWGAGLRCGAPGNLGEPPGTWRWGGPCMGEHLRHGWWLGVAPLGGVSLDVRYIADDCRSFRIFNIFQYHLSNNIIQGPIVSSSIVSSNSAMPTGKLVTVTAELYHCYFTGSSWPGTGPAAGALVIGTEDPLVLHLSNVVHGGSILLADSLLKVMMLIWESSVHVRHIHA